jgi:hypothetical protein
MTTFRPIRRKEVILTEYPHVSGPSRERPGPVCVECLADVSASAGFACVCGLPLCGRPSCLDGPNHRAECELLQGLQGASSRGSQGVGCQGLQGAGCQGPQGAVCKGPQGAGCQVPQGAGCQGPQGAGCLGPQGAGCQGPQGAGCEGPQEAGYQGHQGAGSLGLQVGDSQGLTEVVWDSDTLQRLLDDLLPLRNAANISTFF